MCKTVFKNHLLRVAFLTHTKGGSRISKDCPPVEDQFCSKNSSKLHGIKNIHILGGGGGHLHMYEECKDEQICSAKKWSMQCGYKIM